MKIVASPDAIGFVRTHGGHVFVWIVSMAYGYQPVFSLEASTESPGASFRCQRVGVEDIDVVLDTSGRDLPDSVELELRGVLRKRIRAYWNGHSFAQGAS